MPHFSPRCLAGSYFLCLALAASSAFAQDKAPTFDVMEYRVLGNTVLPVASIERAVYPFLGTGKSLEIVEQARVELEKAYHDAGFGTVFVDIPEQTVDSGIVRLHVTEGKLRRVAIEGQTFFSARDIRDAIPEAKAGTTPDLKVLQKELSVLNAETGDRQITPVLAAGPRPGTVDLTLKVADKFPLHGSLEINDRYTADTDRLRANGSLSYDNLFNRLDSISLQYQTSGQPSELGVFAANYTAHVSERGDTLSFLYVNSDSNVAALGTLSVLGKGQIFSTRWNLPFVNTAASSQSFAMGLEYKDFKESIQLDSDSQFNTPISYFNLSFGHTGVWRFDGGHQFFWTSSLNMGPRDAGNSDEEFANKRYRGRSNYFYLKSDASARFALPWKMALRVSASGQYAADPIIANEQFSIGGADSVRGYLEAEDLGDIGVRSSIELGAPPLNFFEQGLTLDSFVFFDIGRVSTLNPLPSEESNSALKSWGVGLNVFGFDHVSGSVAWARPLWDGTRTQAGDARWHFSVRGNW